MKTVEQRFWAKVDKTGPMHPILGSRCWLWTASKASRGQDGSYKYGVFRVNGILTYAHRYVYELTYGPVPKGKEIDHICHVETCCNPQHLRAITHKQNTENRRGAYSNSSSGVRGVYWYEPLKRWSAKVHHNQKMLHIGYYDTIEEAESAAIAKRNELFTHNDLDRVGAE